MRAWGRGLARNATLDFLALGTRAVAALPLAPRGRGGGVARGDAESAGAALRAACHVLVVRLDELGDVVLTTAFLRELRRFAPSARITLAVNPATAALMRGCPYVDAVEVMAVSGPTVLRPVLLPWRAWRLARRWRRAANGPPVDVALLPRWASDAVFATYLAYFSGAPMRVGFSERVDARKRAFNRGYDRLLTHAMRGRGWQHEVEHTLDLLRFFGIEPRETALELWEGPEAAVDARALLGPALTLAGGAPGGPARPVVAIAPSGGHSRLKQWAPARLGELARRLQRELGAVVVLVGTRHDAAVAARVAAECDEPPLSLVGATDLPQLAAVLRRCSLFVGNDAGPLHLAAAVGTPVVAVFGSSDATRFGPWSDAATVVWRPPPCAPIFRSDRPDRCAACVFTVPACLDAVTVDEVFEACRARLAVEPGRAKVTALAPASPV